MYTDIPSGIGLWADSFGDCGNPLHLWLDFFFMRVTSL